MRSSLTIILNSISERFGSKFEQIDISPKAAAITLTCKALPMACNRQSSLWARILLLHSLTHSLTQKDSIVAYASLGSKLQKLDLGLGLTIMAARARKS